MSGGHYDYAYAKTERFARELHDDLMRQGETDHNGDLFPEWSARVSTELRLIAELAIYASRLMREAEWLYSGDHSEESFLELIKNHRKEYLHVLANG